LRAARAALTEALAWGAEVIVAKGDLTHDSEAAEFEAFAGLLASFPVPHVVVLGNHDVRHHADGPTVLARHGIHAFVEAASTDLPGVRLVTAHTPRPHDKRGHLGVDETELIAKLAGEAPAGVVLVLHHPPQLTPFPVHYPPGLVPKDSARLLREVAEANPASIVIAGHTHRNRLHLKGPLPVVEVGSPKDYPGGWAGYAVHEGGIRQVVRRVSRPDVIAWTEATATAVFGQWGRWSPGTLADRCWSYSWPTRPEAKTGVAAVGQAILGEPAG
ncbi:MAG: metallophosphoesterase family protein, partial [Acidimicrobiales bacterium]